jgi:hypothetical protein
MAKWWNNVKRVRMTKRGARFLTLFDTAEAKRAESITNSRIKRGEIPAGNSRYLSVCSCGVSGCIVSSECQTTKEQWDWFYKQKGW